MTRGWKHLPPAHPASHRSSYFLSLCVPLCLSIQTASEDHHMSNTVCTQTLALVLGLWRTVKANWPAGPLTLSSLRRPSTHLSTKASNITFSPLAQPMAAPWYVKCTTKCKWLQTGSAGTWIGCWWLIKRHLKRGAVSVTCYLRSLKWSLSVL